MTLSTPSFPACDEQLLAGCLAHDRAAQQQLYLRYKTVGSLDATVQYADLTGTDLQMAFSCQAEKSALSLRTVGGSYAIRNRYGSIRLEPTEE